MSSPQKAPQGLSSVPPASPAVLAERRRQKDRERRQRLRQRTVPIEVHTHHLKELRRELKRQPQPSQLSDTDLIRLAVSAYRRELRFKRELQAHLESDLAS